MILFRTGAIPVRAGSSSSSAGTLEVVLMYSGPAQMVGDCSGGCKWFHTLGGRASSDWGVCGNPASHRAGLLTFEHQGCPEFEQE